MFLGLVLGLGISISSADDSATEQVAAPSPLAAAPELSEEDVEREVAAAVASAEQQSTLRTQSKLASQRAVAKERLARAMGRADAAQRKAVTAAVKKVRAVERARTAKLVAAARAAATAAAAQPSAPVPLAGGGTDPRFSYCYEAVDAGYGPYRRGQDPEYDWYDDADNDGVVCE